MYAHTYLRKHLHAHTLHPKTKYHNLFSQHDKIGQTELEHIMRNICGRMTTFFSLLFLPPVKIPYMINYEYYLIKAHSIQGI